MDHQSIDLLEDVHFPDPVLYRKRLLPVWIKVFAWIFLVVGALAIVCIVIGMFVDNIALAIYHLQSNEIFSLTGLIIISIFLLKGITSYGLLWGKNWGVQLAIIDAALGIIICFTVIMFLPASFTGTTSGGFPLELLLLIPYLIKMLTIKDNWKMLVK